MKDSLFYENQKKRRGNKKSKCINLSDFPWASENSPPLFKVRLSCKLVMKNPKYWHVAVGRLRKDKNTEDLLGLNYWKQLL